MVFESKKAITLVYQRLVLLTYFLTSHDSSISAKARYFLSVEVNSMNGADPNMMSHSFSENIDINLRTILYHSIANKSISPVQFRSKPLKPNFVSIYFEDFSKIFSVAQRRQ